LTPLAASPTITDRSITLRRGTKTVSRLQVLIVGAGPTGLVLALWLAKVGTPFRLIDKNSGPG
jgi:cation diffusion facilitator CzcD-associated flavoprotein CzcO